METGRDATKGKTVYHLKSLGILMVVYVEMRCATVDERLSAIAQVIAECDGKASLRPRNIHRFLVLLLNPQFVIATTRHSVLTCRSMVYSVTEVTISFSLLIARANSSRPLLSLRVLSKARNRKDFHLCTSRQMVLLRVLSSTACDPYARPSPTSY